MANLVDELSAVFAVHPNRDRVPAASLAVLAGDELVTVAWGVDPETVFQAASISKPVAGLTALRLVASGDLELDADVNDALRSWQLPARPGWKPVVTLRHLLSHGGALTMGGYPGYPVGAPLPTLVDILDGQPPANTAPVRVDGIPGLTYRYSGGGYVIVQQLLEDVTGMPYAELAAELVLRPAGMATATYQQPALTRAAPAHVGGAPVPGGWHVYPEQATAGLWCTPTDLVRFARAIQASAAGDPDALLPADTAREMLTIQSTGWGLGVQLDGDGPHRRFGHGGSNLGYQCNLLATVASGHAAAAMTNSEDGGPVARSLIAAAALGTRWPDPPQFPSTDPSSGETTESINARYVGEYVTDPGMVMSILGDSRGHFLVLAGQPPIALDPQSPTIVQAPGASAFLEFTLDPIGYATALTVHQYGTEITAHRR
jgi:CubicO group peptidase (beta-lactamase class C family)